MKWKILILLCIATTLAQHIYKDQKKIDFTQTAKPLHSVINANPSSNDENKNQGMSKTRTFVTSSFKHVNFGNNPHSIKEKYTVEEKENQNNCSSTESESNETVDIESSREYVDVGPAASLELTDRVIVTEHGPVIGFYLHESTEIRGYFDIPYGSVTGLFAPPGKPQLWSDIHQVSSHSKRCPQIEEPNKFVGDLDCLTLSLFKHSNVRNAPVLFHIHDGDLQTGSGDPSVYGPEHLVSRGVILVLPNYRIGPLGFLCLQNDMVPGNAGLKDLALALEWTAKNIAVFGGDASNIAISGDGKAGALVGLLALSPMTSKYISKVITESGSVLSPSTIDRNPIETAAKLAEFIKENISETIDLQTLVSAARNFDIRPCIERGEQAFMNKTPREMLKEATNIDKDFMIGSARHAGLREALGYNEASLAELNKDFSQMLPEDLKFSDQEEKTLVAQQVKKHYFDDYQLTLDAKQISKLSLFYTDSLYLGPSLRFARYLTKAGGSVFFYEFAFVGNMNRELNNLKTNIKEAVRGDIKGYVFTQDGEFAEPDTGEEKMVHLLADFWVNFLKNGNPSADGVEWNEFKETDETEEEWLTVDLEPKVQKGIHIDRVSIWTALYKNHYMGSSMAKDLRSLPLYTLLATLVCLCLYH